MKFRWSDGGDGSTTCLPVKRTNCLFLSSIILLRELEDGGLDI